MGFCSIEKNFPKIFPRATLQSMEIVHAIILGFVQGITEFLPVSSSGHLWLLMEYWDIRSLSLEVVLHAGSLIAVIGFFWNDILRIIRDMFTKGGDPLGWKLVVATVLTAPTGILMHNFFTGEMTTRLVGITLLVTAGLIAAAEYFRPQKVCVFTWKIAIFLGLVQGIAVLPGISRSGLTIAFLILIGLPRKQAAETSFLLAIPTILGALLFASMDTASEILLFLQPATWIGFAVSAVAAVAAIAWMLKLIEGKWIWFAPYCALMGVYLIF